MKHLFWLLGILSFCSRLLLAQPLKLEVIPKAGADQVKVECRISANENVGEVQLQAQIAAQKGTQPLWSGTLGQVTVTTGEKSANQTISHLRPGLWSPIHPTLYDLTVTAIKEGQTIAKQTVRFGFRSFESLHGQVCLNGKPLFLKGIAINPPGRTIPAESGESRRFAEDYVRFLKEKNVNIIRLTHDSQVWFDVCDELGMMIYQGQYGSPPGAEPAKRQPPMDFNESVEAYKRLFETYARHPSSVVYVLSNELPVSGTRGKAFHDYLTRACAELKSWDATRLYIGNAGYGEGREGDICDVHRYWGWYYNTFLTYYNLRYRDLFTSGGGSILRGRGIGEDEDAIADIQRNRGNQGDEIQTAQQTELAGEDQSLVTSAATKRSGARNRSLAAAAVGDSRAPEQPLTFSECVGNFTGPSGEYNLIVRKQLGAQLNWTGHSANQREDALEYQSFMAQQAAETFRRLRPMNPRLSGLMPFSIFFYNWSGVTNFNQMKPKPALDALATAYQPVLLTWELWTPQVYSGSVIRPVAHVINDSEDGSGLTNATLQCQLRTKEGRAVVRLEAVKLPKLPYYKTWSSRLEMNLPADLPTGEYVLSGLVMMKGRVLSRNECDLFVASKRWSLEPRTPPEQEIVLYDPSGKTARAIQALQIPFRRLASFRKGLPVAGAVVIGEDTWNSATTEDAAKLRAYVRNGGRVLCLKQERNKFDTSWLAEPIAFFTASANAPTYPPASRPFSGNMRVNPERPEHPAFTWLNRHRFELWSDYTNWEQTRPGFPQVYPVTEGFRLTKAESLEHTAILADYDRGLEGIALCEMFDGRGSVILSAFDIVHRAGLDPVADRLLANLLRYAASQKNHETHPLVDHSIEWGNYASERGIITGPLNGLVLNADWVRPPTNPSAQPLTQEEGAWNVRPGDQFAPRGRSPFGPYGYSTGSTLRDLNRDSETGSGVFWVRIPGNKSKLATTAENRSDQPAELSVSVNNAPATKTEIPAGKTVTINTSFPSGQPSLSVRYTGSKKLVLLRTSFE